MPGIRVGHDDIRRKLAPIAQAHAIGAVAREQDLINFAALKNFSTLLIDDFRHRGCNRGDAADRIMDAKFLLEMRNEDVHRRDVKGIPTNEQRVK